MSEIFDAKLFWTILHLIGVAVGLGGALFGDRLFFLATKNRVISKNEYTSLKRAGQFTWWGLILLIVSGVGLFALDPARYMDSTKFLSKMAIVAVIAINGAVFHGIHFKKLKQLIGVRLPESRVFRRASTGMFISGAVSIVSWLSALMLGSLSSLPFSTGNILALYLLIVLLGVFAALLFRRRFLAH
jgi:uncharacterized membrane protein